MRREKDWEDLIKVFNKYDVEYCILGAIAASYHAKPRFTSDIDILIKNSDKNSKKVVKAISDFMGVSQQTLSGEFGLESDYFASKKPAFFQIGQDPVKIHIINQLETMDTDEVLKDKIKGTYGNQDAFFINLEYLIEAKKAAGRPKDKEDLKHLRKAQKKNNSR